MVARARERFAGERSHAGPPPAPGRAPRGAPQPDRDRRAQVRDDEPAPLPQPAPRDRDVASEGAQFLRRRAQLGPGPGLVREPLRPRGPRPRRDARPTTPTCRGSSGVADRMRGRPRAPRPGSSTWSATRSTGCSPTTSTTWAAGMNRGRWRRRSSDPDSAYVARSRYAMQAEPYLRGLWRRARADRHPRGAARQRARRRCSAVFEFCRRRRRLSPHRSSSASGRPAAASRTAASGSWTGPCACPGCGRSIATSTACPSRCAGWSSGSSTIPAEARRRSRRLPDELRARLRELLAGRHGAARGDRRPRTRLAVALAGTVYDRSLPIEQRVSRWGTTRMPNQRPAASKTGADAKRSAKAATSAGGPKSKARGKGREARRLPAGRHGLSREDVTNSQRQRLLDAMASRLRPAAPTPRPRSPRWSRARASRGRPSTSSSATRRTASSPRMDDWIRMLAAAIQPVVYAERDGSGWPGKVRDVITALLDFIAAKPDHATAAIVEALAAGERAYRPLQRRRAPAGLAARPGPGVHAGRPEPAVRAPRGRSSAAASR